MTTAELDAIRERNEARKRHNATVLRGLATGVPFVMPSRSQLNPPYKNHLVEETIADIDALLAEVVALRANTERPHRLRNCACGHPPEAHDSVLACVSCDAEMGCH